MFVFRGQGLETLMSLTDVDTVVRITETVS